MAALRLPPDIEAVIRKFYTCEFTTVNKRGDPVTWPTLPYYHQPEGQIIVTASIAFPVKTYNARRHPQVALLFSDPTGSRLHTPPAVLVQGDATITEIVDNPLWALEIFKMSIRRQPDSHKYIRNPIAQRLFRFYFQRIAIIVQPRRILAWPQRDFSIPPVEIEMSYVE
jgi:pyridoxamine 5'-phosphate oxidase-like protein